MGGGRVVAVVGEGGWSRVWNGEVVRAALREGSHYDYKFQGSH